jgi:hypothetical protein
MKNKLPLFKSAEDEARFWDTHSVADYWDQMKETDEVFVLSPGIAHRIRERSRRKAVSLRLAYWEIDRSKEIAKKKKVPYQSLIREWLDEGIKKESLAAA